MALKSVQTCIPVFFYAWTCAVAAPVQTLTRCEDLSGWSASAQLASDAREGSSSIAASIPAGETELVSYNLAGTGLSISNSHSLGFWWKAEGNGLRDFRIRVRDHPLEGGAQLTYRLWSGEAPPHGWQLAVVELAKPDRSLDDGEQDQRLITFRASSREDSEARLFIDHVVSMDRTFSWRIRAPRQGDSAVSLARPGADQSSLYFPIDFVNHATSPFWISVGSEGQTLWGQILQPGSNEVLVPIPQHLLDGREDPDRISLWAQLPDLDHTRRHWVADLRQGGRARVWDQFVSARQSGTEAILPDFSYAGYHYFERRVPDATHPVFDVTEYGAIADDDLSDQSAIASAIAAAVENGSGIVFFPPGEFLVNTDADKNEAGEFTPINIHDSNIVLRGSGSRQGGTIIRQVNHMPPLDDNLYSSPYMFHFSPRRRSSRVLATITEGGSRETFWLEVADSSRLEVGRRVTVAMKSTAAVNEFLAPRLPEPLGERLLTDGIEIVEEHAIAEVQGNRIRLSEPLRANVNPEYEWKVRSHPHLEEIGVEDISFHGSFLEEFVHHKNAIHDGGWSLLKLNRCVNCWVRRTSFVNASRALDITSSAAVSVYHVTVAGNAAHYAVKSQGSYGVWVALSEDLAGQQHGVGMSHGATGTVFWRVAMHPGQSIDIHKTVPSYANLYDQVSNGRLYGSSGAGIPPHHLRHLVFWNFNHGGDDTYYDFWEGYLRFLHPIVVGFHGNPATFNVGNLEVLESNGTAMEPASLFEEQLKMRLTAVPVSLDGLNQEWETLRNTPLPSFSVPESLELPLQ